MAVEPVTWQARAIKRRMRRHMDALVQPELDAAVRDEWGIKYSETIGGIPVANLDLSNEEFDAFLRAALGR